jgi:DNA modification methylase
MCANGYPDYIVTMRKPGKNLEPIAHGRGFESYAGEMPEPTERKQNDPRINKYSHKVWQRYASPVWFDIRQTYTLNSIKSDKDEKHICCLQLDTVERCLDLWSNRDDLILSPFAGIGTEGYQSILMGRRFIGVELKNEYFNQAVINLKKAEAHKDREQHSLFSLLSK